MINTMKVMADNKLDAIVYKTVEHTATLIRDYTNPPYSNMKGTTHLSTFLGPITTISVPAGFTQDGLPVGITFFGRAFSEAAMIKLGYAYEQATHHRKPPSASAARRPTTSVERVWRTSPHRWRRSAAPRSGSNSTGRQPR